MDAFQIHLAQLSQSITSYKPQASLASDLVADSDQIHEDINEFSQRLHTLEINTLQTSSISSKLSDTMETILIELGNAKHELDKLPYQKSEKPTENLSTENTSQVLAYALKLAKFTKLSKSLNGLVHPNNFIWPADDSLRRGGLAIMNTVGEKVVALENGEPLDSVTHGIQGNINTEQDINIQQHIEESLPERRESFSITNVHEPPKIDPSAALVGLDLMDSDDEEDDDDDDKML